MPLSIIVAGGGTCGLCTAAYLRATGHTVTLVERTPFDFSASRGWTNHYYSNGLRPLARLGITLDDLQAIPLQSWWFRDWKNDLVGEAKTHFLQQYGTHSASSRRAHVQVALHRVATRSDLPALIDGIAPGPPVTMIHGLLSTISVDSVCVSLLDGRILHADVLLGCDGIRSRVRDALYTHLELPPPQPQTHGLAYFSGLVPTSYFASCAGRAAGLGFLAEPVMRSAADRQLPHQADDASAGLAKFTCKSDPKRHHFVLIHMNAAETLLILILPSEPFLPRFEAARSSLLEHCTVDDVKTHLQEEYHPKLHGIFEAMTEAHIWLGQDVDAIPRLAGGRCALAGDAAHGMGIFIGQGACTGLEDAEALAYFLQGVSPHSPASSPFSLTARLRAYERHRLSRVHAMQAYSRHMGWCTNGDPERERAYEEKGAFDYMEHADEIWGWPGCDTATEVEVERQHETAGERELEPRL